MLIELASKNDIEPWMSLVDKVKGGFPGLETKEKLNKHRDNVLEFMRKKSAICAKIDNLIVGTLLFSKQTNTLCFLAVDEKYRRQHIAEKMFCYMLTFMQAKKDVVVTTYRAGVKEGIPAREFYIKMGFVEGKRMEEFGCPVQEFVLKR